MVLGSEGAMARAPMDCVGSRRRWDSRCVQRRSFSRRLRCWAPCRRHWAGWECRRWRRCVRRGRGRSSASGDPGTGRDQTAGRKAAHGKNERQRETSGIQKKRLFTGCPRRRARINHGGGSWTGRNPMISGRRIITGLGWIEVSRFLCTFHGLTKRRECR